MTYNLRLREYHLKGYTVGGSVTSDEQKKSNILFHSKKSMYQTKFP